MSKIFVYDDQETVTVSVVDEDQVNPGNLVPARLDLSSGGTGPRDSYGWRNIGLDLIAKKVVVNLSTNIILIFLVLTVVDVILLSVYFIIFHVYLDLFTDIMINELFSLNKHLPKTRLSEILPVAL